MSDWHEMAARSNGHIRAVPRIPREHVSDSRILGGIAIITFFWAIGFAMGIFAHVLFAD